MDLQQRILQQWFWRRGSCMNVVDRAEAEQEKRFWITGPCRSRSRIAAESLAVVNSADEGPAAEGPAADGSCSRGSGS